MQQLVLLSVVVLFLLFLVFILWFTKKKELSDLDEKYKEKLQVRHNKSIDLTRILKGHEGEKIYCALTGEYVTIDSILDRPYRPIIVKDNDGVRWPYPKEGYKFDDYPNGECMLFPSQTERDWSNYGKRVE